MLALFNRIIILIVILIYVLGEYISLVNGFNIDLKSPLLKTGPDGSSFGFSLLGYTHFSGQKGYITSLFSYFHVYIGWS